MVDDTLHEPLLLEMDRPTVTVPVTRTVLRDCHEVVGGLHGLDECDGELRVIIHDRLLVYPSGSEEATTIKAKLSGVPLGTRVGVLCLVVEGQQRIFVRVCNGTE